MKERFCLLSTCPVARPCNILKLSTLSILWLGTAKCPLFYIVCGTKVGITCIWVHLYATSMLDGHGLHSEHKHRCSVKLMYTYLYV